MNDESKLYRLVLVSPWPLLIFLVIPLLVILSVALHFRIPLIASTTPLLVNNVCFAIFIACRLLRYLAVMRKPLRYGAACCRPRQSITLPLPVAEVRASLRSSGYLFGSVGNYGEKQDLGYLGTTVLYCGLLILLSVGSLDNLRKFSGVLLDGMGPTTDLNNILSYRSIAKGPLAATPRSLPRMQITNQFFPDSTYPLGATEVSFHSEDGKALKYLLKPRDPVTFGDYDIYMAKLVFEPQIVIKRSDTQQPLFDSIVTLNPLVQKRGVYSFYGLFQGYNLAGGVYYQPEKSSLLVVVSRNEKKVVTEMAFQVDKQVEQGDFIISCAKMGQWSEIHVVHRRHKVLLVVGGIIALVGLLLRVVIRPQRVWLEEAAEGCTIWSSGKETMNVLKSKD
ncbi:resB-like family protein [Geobacter sp. OR-1]|uniref:hypothetical protein n=1 Tax=Geobacter sp. OR-1 TaxID=1266765 RepID=UPI000542C9BA|nr:hypothetical protein [Geobacter sp. OR-1]GAM08043.1 resB-like family protein [Geobacter sp. OR-1]